MQVSNALNLLTAPILDSGEEQDLVPPKQEPPLDSGEERYARK